MTTNGWYSRYKIKRKRPLLAVSAIYWIHGCAQSVQWQQDLILHWNTDVDRSQLKVTVCIFVPILVHNRSTVLIAIIEISHNCCCHASTSVRCCWIPPQNNTHLMAFSRTTWLSQYQKVHHSRFYWRLGLCRIPALAGIRRFSKSGSGKNSAGAGYFCRNWKIHRSKAISIIFCSKIHGVTHDSKFLPRDAMLARY